MSREKAIEQIEEVLEIIYQKSEGHCFLCGTIDYPVKGDKIDYENVAADEAEEWRIDHQDDCPIKYLDRALALLQQKV